MGCVGSSWEGSGVPVTTTPRWVRSPRGGVVPPPACRLSAARHSETDVACALGAGLHALPPPGRGWGTASSVNGLMATVSSHAHELGCQSWRGPGVTPPVPSLLALGRLLRLMSALPWRCDSRAINLPRPRWEAGGQVKLQEAGLRSLSPRELCVAASLDSVEGGLYP